jgi:hypothetical protein
MPPKRAHDTDHFELRSPHTLTIKDLVTIISMAISLALAWGVFDTRITVLEKEAIAFQSASSREQSDIGDINSQLRRLELRVQDDGHFIDDLYRDLKKPVPRHTDTRD